jgi:phosphate transport system protein
MRRTRQAFDEQLEQLQQRLLEMSAFVEAMLEKAVRALRDQDAALAQAVLADDDTADKMDLEIEQHCMRLLALQQPMSRDLRIIGTTMKVIADVERIGDYSVDVARTALRLAGSRYFKPLVDIPKMAELVGTMLRDALQALVHHDLDLVAKVVRDDDEVDRMWYRLLDELEMKMQQDPSIVPQAIAFLLVARYLERVADHTVNIAERVAYMETGRMEDLAASHRADYAEEKAGSDEPPRAP